MDYEKKYKEALERAREYHSVDIDNTMDIKARGIMEYLFPELKESEDERIRGAIIHFISHTPTVPKGIIGKKIMIAWLEKQGEQKQEINNFDVLPGLYKCVHRMFDGTPDGRLLFEVGNVYRCLSKHDRAEFEVSYGHSVYLEDPVVCKHFIPFEKQDEVESDNDDIEVEEKGIRKAFNKIWDEKQGESSDQIHYWTEEEIEPIISDYLRGTEHYGGMIARLRCLKPKSLEKQCKQKPQRMISAEAKEAMYKKPADTVEQKCEESKTKIFDAPTPFEDKLYAFVAACEFLAIPSKIEFILEHSQEILDAAKEQIGKEQSSAWSEEDERTIHNIDAAIRHEVVFPINELKSMEIWLESLKYRIRPKHEWKRDEKMFQLIEDVIDVYRKTQGSVVGGIYTEELKDFLNCIASKQDWKPSNEQIEILDMVLTNESMDDNIARILRELREQLKKLREE